LTGLPPADAAPLLVAENIAKSFGPTRALAGADLAIAPGEVVALMGANGAGKSTLVKILSGAYRADGGTIRFGGQPVSFASPRAAKEAGIATVHQATDQGGAAGLTVAENLVLEDLCRSGPFLVSPREIRKRAKSVAALLDIDLPLERDFGLLRPAERQLVAIARAAAARSSILILDEPTSSLSAGDSERLFAIIERLKKSGLGILYISHRVADLQRIADRAVVLRGGRVVGSYRRPIDFGAAITAMIGRSLDAPSASAAMDGGPDVLTARAIRLIPGAAPFDLSVRAGEVVAITGALGSGKSRFLNIIFGTEKATGGDIAIDGKAWQSRRPGDAIARGVFMAAEDRWRSSLLPATVPGASIAGTIALPHLRRWFPSGILRNAREREAASDAIRRLGIRAKGPDDSLDQLSGGNQQKVVLARWQAVPSRLLLLDEPFQGVDVGARADLIDAIRKGQGDAGVLIATSDAEEALEVADRILVMRDHTIVGALGGAEAGAEALIEAIDRVEATETGKTET
jgi:simple sugar transport system ATP-binding protein